MASPTTSESGVAVASRDEPLRMSYDEYVEWYDKEAGRRGEWVDGEVIVFMATSVRHGEIITFLLTLLNNYLLLRRAGRVFSQEVELRTREGAAREPDLFVVLNEHRDRLETMRLRGAADLVVELVSPDSVARDRRDKMGEYAAVGIPEYWIVDPREGKLSFEVYRLETEGYYVPIAADSDGRLHSFVLPDLWVDPAWLGQDELPDPLRLSLAMAGIELPSS